MFINKKGYTLVEVLFSVSILGVLVLVMTSMDRSALMTERQVEFIGYRQPVVRILQILAQDIHSAQSFKISGPSSLLLQMEGRQVQWSSNQGNVVRRIGKARQMWLLKKGITFRAAELEGTVEIHVSDISLNSFYSIRGGIR